MTLTIVLLCLAVQRWLQFVSATRQFDWFTHYFAWLKQRYENKSFWPHLGGVLLIILPAWIIYLLVATLIYHVIGMIAYYLLTLVVFWYCVDARSLWLSNINGENLRHILSRTYQRLFAMIFWLFLLGSGGVVLYSLVLLLDDALEFKADEKSVALRGFTLKVEAVLDWVPLRLMGLSYALVGHFTPAFQYWYKHLWTGLDYTKEEATTCAFLAAGLKEESGGVSEQQLSEMNHLVNRALLVWLVVIALFTIGAWIG